MCGIAGYIGEKVFDFSLMTGELLHRGPDNTGSFTTKHNNKHLFLGHTRLSIVDISNAGNQPMASANDDVVLVFNGEIYNFQELKGKYLRNLAFESETDTEVLLHLYRQHGINFMHELVGDFAIAVLDQQQKKLFLIRDRLGVKPVYYAEVNSQFYFASEIKSILAAGIVPQANFDQLQNYFAFKYVPKNETLFNNIHRLPPGSFIEFDYEEQKGKIVTYWKPKKRREIQQLNYADAQQATENLLSQAVKMQLMGDVPIGNFLSGGLDSSIIASYLKNKKEVNHYCAKKDEQDLEKEGTTSDYAFAKQLAENWGLNFQSVNIGSEELTIEQLKTVLRFSEDLIADGSQIPSYLITKEAAKKSKVVLSGMGADELFMGYAGHQLAYLSKHYSFIPAGIFSKISVGKGKMKAYKRYLKKWAAYNKYNKIKYGLFNVVGDWERSLSVFEGEGNPEQVLDGYFDNNKDTWDNMFRFETENFLVKNLHYFDRMCMANSVEGRVPFMDYRIVEFAYNINPAYKLNSFNNPKRILKDTYKKAFPKEIVNRRKAGFGMPLRSIFSEKEKVNQLLDKDFFAGINGFSLPNINTVINQHVNGKEDNSSIIFALISFQEWYKMYIGK